MTQIGRVGERREERGERRERELEREREREIEREIVRERERESRDLIGKLPRENSCRCLDFLRTPMPNHTLFWIFVNTESGLFIPKSMFNNIYKLTFLVLVTIEDDQQSL